MQTIINSKEGAPCDVRFTSVVTDDFFTLVPISLFCFRSYVYLRNLSSSQCVVSRMTTVVRHVFYADCGSFQQGLSQLVFVDKRG